MFYPRSAQVSVLSFLLFFCFPLLSLAQTFTGNITGTVSDTSGSALAGATVSLKNTATNDTRNATTNESGLYNFPQLAPGTYRLEVTMTGFKKYQVASINLQTSQVAEINAQLGLGDVSESVEVQASAVAIDTQTANKEVTLSSQMVAELPVNARNPFVLVHATAGVTAVRTGVSGATTDQNHNRFSLNGGRGQSGLVLIDGVPATAGDWGGLIASPGVDSIQETQVIRTTFDAQYGRTDGGVVTMITKGGSSQFHGLGFEYLRNSNLDANSWTSNRSGISKPSFQRHQFGGNLSGPIVNKWNLFFFGGYEGLRQASPTQNISSVPTALERQGNFSNTRNADGTLSVIYDPTTTRPNPNGSGFIRDAFPGNVIPANRFDAVGRRIVDLYPNANAAGDLNTQTRNFTMGAKAVTHNDRFDGRIDWAKSSKFTLFGRITKANQTDIAPIFFGNGADSNFGGENPRHFASVGFTFVPSPTFVLNVLVGHGRWREGQVSPSQGQGAAITGLPSSLTSQLQATTLPQFSVANYAQIGNSRFLNFPRQSDTLQVNASKEIHNHSLKFGFQYDNMKLNQTDIYNGTFSFNRGLTAAEVNAAGSPIAVVDSSRSGNAIASLLLGTGSGGSIPYNNQPAYSQPIWAFYFQDSWRMNRRLTLNYGVRLEHQGGRTERYDRINWFDTTSPNAALSNRAGMPVYGGLSFAGPGNRNLQLTDGLNPAPRLGLAYKVTDKLVVRSGIGYYFPTTWVSVASAQGFSTSTSWNSTVGGNGLIPQNPLSNPYPNGLNRVSGSSLGLSTQAGEAVSAWQRSRPSGYSMNYSFDVQYELSKSALIEVGYIGTQGRKLPYGVNRNMNQLNPIYLSLGQSLNDSVANPFNGLFNSGSINGPTIARNQLLRPYPQFTSVNLQGDTPGTSSIYNALSVKFQKRFNNGMSTLVTYQWSKAIDNASETQGWEVGDAFRDYYNQAIERSISAHDLPQSLAFAFVYELPFGRGKSYGAGMNKVTDAILGGWQVSGIGRLSSGLPLQFSAPNTLSAYGFAVQRPNITSTKDLAVSNPTPDNWFNKAAVSAPGQFTIGSAPRWISDVRFGPTRNLDFSLAKNWRVAERLKLQFRAESFNLTNTPQFGRANTTVGAGDFGRVTGLAPGANPHNIQGVLRLSF
ncbi:TonB-dependent receptor [Bryobacter aggregatus]|uniref:TonB-dependent receptor n=1 Tax=Bryobacter aggregatus TaxID=360054 RepID=UPI0004E134A4|nr:TonB-dependent receptor [Bryobacter aggregatus]